MHSRYCRRFNLTRHLLLMAAVVVALVLPGWAIEGPPGFNPGDTPFLGGGSGAGGSGGGVLGGGGGSGLLGEGIDFRGGMLDWEEDEDGHRVAILRNYAVVILPQLTISARNMVLNVELQEIYAEGDVLFDEAGGNAFYADQLTFNYQEWKGLAKNIRIRMDRQDVELPVRDFLDDQPSVSMSNSQSINDSPDQTDGGRFSQLKRMYVQATELRAHDANTFELIDAKITPSGFARPHWFFHSPAALYRNREKIESYHNTVRIGNTPVLYFPYLIRDLQYDWPWMRISGGHTSDYGFFVRTQWGWRLRERPNAYLRSNKIIFDLDVFSRRGLGVGVETTYEAGYLESLGKLKVYGVWEAFTSRGRDWERAIDENEDRIWRDRASNWEPSLYRRDFRWAVDWEHYQQLNDVWDVRAQAHLYHDRDYLKDYDPSRYWNDKEPENSINIRRQDKHWQLELVASSRLSNKWMEQAEYLPELRATVPGMQVGDLPLFLKNDFRLGFVNKRFDEDEYKYTHWTQAWDASGNYTGYRGGLFEKDPIYGHSISRLYDKDNYGTYFRGMNEMRLEAPLKMWNTMTLKPWVGLRTAYYSKTNQNRSYTNAELDMFDPAHPAPNYAYDVWYPNLQYKHKQDGAWSTAVPFGVDLSTRMYSYFGANEQWRLTTEPVLTWVENSKPKLDSRADLFTIDSYDDYSRMRRYGVELHTKLQRRAYESSTTADVPQRDVLDFNVAVYQYPRREDRMRVNNNQRYSELELDLIYRPTEWLSLSGSLDYDIDETSANRAIVSADWRINNMVRAYATHYHYRGRYWRYPDSDASSQTHLAVRTKLWNDSSRYSLEGAVAYEWRDTDEDWRSKEDGVRHGFNKYRVTLFRDMDTFEMSLSYVRDRNADDHGIFFNLSPKSFMGYDRPPPGYSVEIEDLSDSRYGGGYLDAAYLIDAPMADADIKDVQF